MKVLIISIGTESNKGKDGDIFYIFYKEKNYLGT